MNKIYFYVNDIRFYRVDLHPDNRSPVIFNIDLKAFEQMSLTCRALNKNDIHQQSSETRPILIELK